jgi:trehalose-phosphatase
MSGDRAKAPTPAAPPASASPPVGSHAAAPPVGSHAAAPPPGVPAALWSRVAAAAHRLLMLDYDGTLAPFQIHTEVARPRPRLLNLVARIAEAGRESAADRGAAADRSGAAGGDRAEAPRCLVAIISGRTLPDLERLVGRHPIILIGEHGWDVHWPGRAAVQHPLPEAAAIGLRRAAAAATDAGFARHLERKRCALILHTRGLAPSHAEAMARACASPWALEAASGDLRLDRIDGGIELRAAARDKGTAVRELVAAAPRGAAAVCLGDDVSDEDAFREVAPYGFGLRVGPDERPSHAAGRLPTHEDIEVFLAAWLAILRPRPRGR